MKLGGQPNRRTGFDGPLFPGHGLGEQGRESPEYFAKARPCFERALALDPVNVNAMVGIGRIDAEMVGGGLADDREARLASAASHANQGNIGRTQ